MTLVQAAGGIVWRARRRTHRGRPRPPSAATTTGRSRRASARASETDEACALREVEEETGLACTLGDELPSTEYVDSRDRPKIVRWWTMEPLGETSEIDGDEVDEARWVSTYEASLLLTYERDRRLLDSFAAVAA